MRNLLLAVHIGGAILFIGPTTVAASTFARHAVSESFDRAVEANRMTRAYGTTTIAVPAVGAALAARIEAFDETWVIAAIAVFAVGVAALAVGHLPAQRLALAALTRRASVPLAVLTRLRLTAGVYSITWVVILWLMIAKPS